jgi:hypothetical protein
MKRLSERANVLDMLKNIQNSKVAIQASVLKDGQNNLKIVHSRQNVIADNAEYNDASQVFDNSIDSTLSELVIN